MQGNIIALSGKDALLRVVGKGGVEGEIRVPRVIINGMVQGDVYSSQHLELASRSRVQGNVFYTLVEMAAGAEVNGSLTHLADAEAPAAEQPVFGSVEKTGRNPETAEIGTDDTEYGLS